MGCVMSSGASTRKPERTSIADGSLRTFVIDALRMNGRGVYCSHRRPHQSPETQRKGRKSDARQQRPRWKPQASREASWAPRVRLRLAFQTIRTRARRSSAG